MKKLIKEVRQGHIMYNDETGWSLMENLPDVDYRQQRPDHLLAAESRGRGIMEELMEHQKAYSMHDGLASHLCQFPKTNLLYCWLIF